MGKRQSNIDKIMQLFNTVSADEAKTLIDVAKAVIHQRFPSKPRVSDSFMVTNKGLSVTPHVGKSKIT